MKLIISIFLTLLMLGDTGITEIKLDYYRTPDNQVWSNGFDELTLKVKGEVILKVLTNKEGTAIIKKDLLKKYREVDVFLTTIGVEELYLTTINNHTIDKYIVNIPRYYTMRFKRAVCPKCKKVDKVYKAIYGDNQVLTMKITEKGDTAYSNISGRKYYMGTCVTNELNPKWYCDRDDIQF